MKKKVLETIYQTFDAWNSDKKKSCRKGCSACCTQNVTITATEAELIHDYAVTNKLQSQLAALFQNPPSQKRPQMSTNDFAKACLEGRDVELDSPDSPLPCPLLVDDACQIYPVRPFACRSFISETTCDHNSPATISESYAATITAVSQIIEHLGQKEYWGNLFDVLIAMSDISAYKECAEKINAAKILDARMKTLTAKPLSGFLLTEEDLIEAEPLLNAIFSATVEGRSIEDILNGK